MLRVLTIKQNKTRNTKKLLAVMDMFIVLITVMVTEVYTYIQTHQIMYINYVQFFVYQLYLNKVVVEGRRGRYMVISVDKTTTKKNI